MTSEAPASPDRAIPDNAIAALRQGNKIEAIRLTREATAMGLKDSKEAVEACLAANRPIREAFESARPASSGSVGSLFIVVAILAAAVWWFFLRDA